MLKKIAALGSFLTIMSATSTIAHEPYYKTGFLAGAHVGISNGWGSYNNIFSTIVFPPNYASRKSNIKTSAMYGIFAG